MCYRQCICINKNRWVTKSSKIVHTVHCVWCLRCVKKTVRAETDKYPFQMIRLIIKWIRLWMVFENQNMCGLIRRGQTASDVITRKTTTNKTILVQWAGTRCSTNMCCNFLTVYYISKLGTPQAKNMRLTDVEYMSKQNMKFSG